MNHATDPLIGRVLDARYRVGPRIARGGMAVVYEGTDLRLDRGVAIKVMHAGLADDAEFVGRFEREARSAARLAHPNVVAVFDQGDDDGTLFLVMEHVSGTTLRELIRGEAPLAPGRALALLEPVLSALNAAHRAGMIHRDVKPENVLIPDTAAPAGIKVADFGLARAINAETQHTATGGVLIGTVSYLAPELVTNGRADARADVYAAGVLLYEMLTGRKPHQADTPIQVAYKHVHEDIPAPSQIVPGLPLFLDALVARATARDTTVRPADAGVLLHQVRRVRQALDQGVTEDADLVADLTPVRREDTNELTDLDLALDPGPDATTQLPVRILDPAEPGELAAFEAVAGLAHDDAFDSVPISTSPPRSALRRPPAPPAEPPGEDLEDPAEPPYRPPRRGRGPWLLALVVALIAALALGGWYFGIARYTVTPGVIDLPRAQAETKLTDAGLTMRVVGEQYSETVAKGAVLSTDPTAGSRILRSGTVEVVISRGPERHKVPKLRGKTLDQAQAAILDAQLSFGRSTARYDEKVPQGEVISSDPARGTPLRRDSAVDLVVSKGKRPIKIPDLTGRSAAKARERLVKLGFTVSDGEREYSEEVPANRVIRQSPNSGTGHRGDQVTLVVSRGPELVTIPNVRGQAFGEAKKALEDLGLVVDRREADLYIGLNRVAGVSPEQGTRVRKGSTVTLVVV